MELLYEDERVDKLIELCNDDFLERLCEVARLYGWQGDYTEIVQFIEDLHLYADKGCPEIEPYELRE